MSVLEQAQKSFAEKLTEVREIEVPEWGDESGPLIIYVRPTNLAERSRLFKDVEKDTLESMTTALILRVRDKAGLPVFTQKDKQALMTSVDPDVINRVCAEINSDFAEISEDLKDAAKN